MAEARQAVHSIRVSSLHLDSLTTRAKLRGPQIHGVEGGAVIVIPAPKYFVRLVQNKFKHGWNHFQSAIWPAPVWAVLLAISVFVAVVMQSPPEHFFRCGPIANALWWVDEHFVAVFGLGPYLPKIVRVIYIAMWAALLSILIVALIQRYFMRILLNYKKWMYESKPSMMTMAWGGMLRFFFLGQREPLLYAFQSAMPRQPVPPIKQTIEKYLRSIEPLIPADQFELQKKEALRFAANEAPRLQRYLVLKSWFSGNYVSDWWEKYVYLRSRTPILINSNYYGLGFNNYIPTSNQTARAAALIHQYMLFKLDLDSEKLQPTVVKGAVPICMRQYERLFSTCRIPGRDTDVIKHLDGADVIHIAVLYKGSFWRVNTFSDNGNALEAYQIQDQLDFIRASVGRALPAPLSAEANLPALTGIDRSHWAQIRETYFAEGLNRISLDVLENAIMVVHLDDAAPTTWTQTGNLALHGNGNTRWCDKSFNLVVFSNGEAAVHAEHTWADAPVIAHAWEWVLLHEVTLGMYDAGGDCKRPASLTLVPAVPVPGDGKASPNLTPGPGRTSSISTASFEEKNTLTSAGVPLPSRLEWLMWPELEKAVLEAVGTTAQMCKDLDLVVGCYQDAEGGYGKGFMKKHRCGPDAWIQLALQIAYFRDQGALHLTYESAAVRLFNEGRTETIRSVSLESRRAVELVCDPAASKEDKIKAIKDSAQQHQSYSRDAGCGKGVDRHLFALYVAAQGLGVEAQFLKDFLGLQYKLSTSQIPQRQTSVKLDKLPYATDLLSPSGGFGPVADDGYGVSYMMADDARTFFHVSSKRSAGNTDSERFRKEIWKALDDLRALFE
mmetsp:Transcript_4768/g.11175  ORF Transcript_4768/g.11175 Transcript_4768/m.11175 type:complete len:838 (-) Transcript_4768:226-2739(-)